ncbi:MAG: signal peptidase I [Clostridiales bacterium]|nr:signal peptidase I [Clostridiales bacterium]
MRLKSRLSSAAMGKHKNEKSYKVADYTDFIITLLMVVIAVFALRMFIFEPIKVDGVSMQPTLIDTENMLVEKVSYWFSTPERGDIIICYFPNRADPNETFVKRIIGLPGETISVKEGAVYINGEKLDESEYWLGHINGNFPEYEIPDGEVFVMGDNRNNSGDSRLKEVGSIPIKRIVGHVLGVISPIKNLREVNCINDLPF